VLVLNCSSSVKELSNTKIALNSWTSPRKLIYTGTSETTPGKNAKQEFSTYEIQKNMLCYSYLCNLASADCSCSSCACSSVLQVKKSIIKAWYIKRAHLVWLFSLRKFPFLAVLDFGQYWLWCVHASTSRKDDRFEMQQLMQCTPVRYRKEVILHFHINQAY
jgi:hypothetical protein